ncbi:MAG: hypothetical protein WC365_07200 [Candidatus Babeliales bacterium]|jgi:hypothetical protein
MKIVAFAGHSLFWFGYAIAMLAFFEQCLDGGSPLWSSVLGTPFLHHGYYGFIIIAVAYFLVNYATFKKLCKRN